MDAAVGMPEQATGSEWREGRTASLDEPSEHAVPILSLTPVPEPRVRDLGAGSACVAVTGMTVMAITAELGRRSGASGRLTALCSAGAGAAAVAPWLVPQFMRHRPWV